MTGFHLSEADRMVKQLAHDFALKEIRPVAADFDVREEYPWEVVRNAAPLGLAGAPLSGPDVEESAFTQLVMAEELAWGCAGIALAILGNALAATAVNLISTPEQRQRFLPHCTAADGHPHPAALALSEPEAGSDAGALQTRALRDGDVYRLNGTKRFITGAGVADLTVVFATEEPGAGFKGISAFVVPPDTPGFSQGTKWRKMGIRASHTADLVLEDVRLPLDHRLGPADPDFRSGGRGILGTLTATRPWIASMAVGLARAAFEYAAAYARERHQFGHPIMDHQGVGFMLADMDIAIEAARLLAWHAGSLIAQGQPGSFEEASKAKCFATDAAMKATTDAVQVCGGIGFMRDAPVEKWMRDAKIFQIFEGTNQIQRLVISRNIAQRQF